MMMLVSIVLEAAIAVIAVLAARQGRPHLYGLALTFAIYVFYDLARFAAMDHRRNAVVGTVPAGDDSRAHRRLGNLSGAPARA